MRDLNPVKTLRDKLDLTQEAFGAKLPGISGKPVGISQVAKMETMPTPEQAEAMLKMAEDIGSIEHVVYFQKLLGQDQSEEGQAVDLSKLSESEQVLAQALIEICREPRPDNVIENNLAAIIWGLRRSRHASQDTEIAEIIADLAPEEKEVLGRFLRRGSDAVKIIANIASGGHREKSSNPQIETDIKPSEKKKANG